MEADLVTIQPAQSQLRKVEIANGKINFACLQADCPKSCCGPFGGVQRGIVSIDGRAFSEIVLTQSDADSLLNAGFAHLLEYLEPGKYRMRTLGDGTCCALKDGLCTVNENKPTVCRAFPFYVDMFVGLCAITECPGFGVGWTRVSDLRPEVSAARSMYSYWLDVINSGHDDIDRTKENL